MHARKYQVNESFFNPIATPEAAYVLGLITTDGCVNRDKTSITIALADKDKDVLEAVAAAMGSTHPIRKFPNPGFRGQDAKLPLWRSVLRVYSKRLVSDLAALGVVGNKTFTVTPWNGPPQLMPHYWRGCVDGDGWVSLYGARGARVGFCGNFAMVSGFVAYMEQTLGRTATIFPRKSIYLAEFTGIRPSRCVAALLYRDATISLSRKRRPRSPLWVWSHLGVISLL